MSDTRTEKRGKCVVCGVGPREIPDRDNPGLLQLRVCRKCHGERIRGDLRAIMEQHNAKR